MPYRPTVFELHRNGRLFPPNYLHESWLDYSTGTPNWSPKAGFDGLRPALRCWLTHKASAMRLTEVFQSGVVVAGAKLKALSASLALPPSRKCARRLDAHSPSPAAIASRIYVAGEHL